MLLPAPLDSVLESRPTPGWEVCPRLRPNSVSYIQVSELDLMLEGSPGSGLARLEASVRKKGLVSLLVTFFLSASPPLTSLREGLAQVQEGGDRGQGSSSWAESSGRPSST